MKIFGKLYILIGIGVTFSLMLFGCRSDAPLSTAGPSPVLTPFSTRIPLPSSIATPTQPSTPTPQPSETPSYDYGRLAYPPPISADHTPSSPSPTFTDTPRHFIDARRLNCEVVGDFQKCYDIRLGLEFEVPSEWGEIDTQLWKGDTGREYYYRFNEVDRTSIYGPKAGGLTRDFSAPRGGDITSFRGFDDNGGCQRYHGASKCEEVQPGVILAVYYPNADKICRPFDNPVFSAGALIAIDLPTHAVVNGFVFVAPFLGEELEAEIQKQAETILGAGISDCTPTTEAEFDVWIDELIASIQAGRADEVTISNLEKIYHLLYSIKFK